MRFLLLLVFFSVSLNATAQDTEIHQIGTDIQLVRLTENTFVHRSFKTLEEYGRVPANGLIYIVDSLCMIFDTPFTVETTVRLLDHLENERGLTIVGLVVNHFHDDCTAGLDSVHARGIPTYAYRKTRALCAADGGEVPQKGFFFRKKRLKIGDQVIINYHPGAGHAPDNIVSYLPSEGVLFGGCMVKSYGAGKGNLEDADLSKWSASVAKVKKQFAEAKHIVPGHGGHGGLQLLDYTIELFAPEDK